MSAIRAIFVGLWRAIESPGLVIWLWLVNFAIALPAGVVMSESIRSSIGSSQVHEELATGFDLGWYGEFREGAVGLERTFTPTIVGPGAIYNNVEGWLFGGLFQQFPGVVGLGVLYALVWALFVGGILDRFSKSEGFFSLSRFFSNGGRFFFRFVRLIVLAGVLYYLIYRFAEWLFGRIDYWTRDVTVEGTVLIYVLLGTAVVVFLLTLVNMAFDYAKIATFVEDRSSMVLAALRGGFSIFLSNSTDPFVPQESTFRVTESLLKAMNESAPDVLIVQTHTHLVTQYTDLYRELASSAICVCTFRSRPIAKRSLAYHRPRAR